MTSEYVVTPTQTKSLNKNDTSFRRHYLTMAVIDLAKISSVLGILYTFCRLKLYDQYSFGRCPWFPMKPPVSSTSEVGILAMVVVDGCVFVSLVAAGLFQGCTRPNAMTLVGI
jgi:hypothetical protein